LTAVNGHRHDLGGLNVDLSEVGAQVLGAVPAPQLDDADCLASAGPTRKIVERGQLGRGERRARGARTDSGGDGSPSGQRTAEVRHRLGAVIEAEYSLNDGRDLGRHIERTGAPAK
jgi:hypothetical protein